MPQGKPHNGLQASPAALHNLPPGASVTIRATDIGTQLEHVSVRLMPYSKTAGDCTLGSGRVPATVAWVYPHSLTLPAGRSATVRLHVDRGSPAADLVVMFSTSTGHQAGVATSIGVGTQVTVGGHAMCGVAQHHPATASPWPALGIGGGLVLIMVGTLAWRLRRERGSHHGGRRQPIHGTP
jgi:hypothetical protein